METRKEERRTENVTRGTENEKRTTQERGTESVARTVLGRDKALHMAAGALVSVVVSVAIGLTTAGALDGPGGRLACGFCGLIGAALAGLGKECWDYFRGGHFDGRDLLATVVGGLAGWLAMAVV